MTKVLLFESDPEFAQTLSSGLEAYGCETTVVDDGEEGISWAAQNMPDLILLTIELPRMNGFSVCNKLKRNADLKSVPLVLLSSDATQETFEQHKRLRTRADEYVHKPVTLPDLVEKLQGVVTLAPSEDVEVLEEDAVDEASVLEPISSLMDDETEQAFGNLVAPEQTAAHADEVEMDELVLEEDDGLKVAPEDPGPLSRPVASSVPPPLPNRQQLVQNEALTAEVAQLREALARLEAELKSARDAAASEVDAKLQVSEKKDAEIAVLERELEHLRAQLSENETGGSAREFLDLREQLNKKDKEIINVRDALTSREKDLVRVNDECIALGRERADFLDQISNLERTRAELEKQRDVLSQDKEQAAKRADDFRAKSERLQGEVDARLEELRGLRESHENIMATRDAQEAAMRDDHSRATREATEAAEAAKEHAVQEAIRDAQEAAAADKEQALIAAAEDANKARTAAVSARELELRAEHDSKLAALHRANEDSLRKLRAEHEHQAEQAAQAAAAQLAARESELEQEKQGALAAQATENEARYQELAEQKRVTEEQRDARILELQNELHHRTRERDEHADTIAQREQKNQELEAALAGYQAREAELNEQLRETSELLQRARSKWSDDLTGIRSAQEALTDALAELKKTQNRPMP